jgi:cell division protein FtsL
MTPQEALFWTITAIIVLYIIRRMIVSGKTKKIQYQKELHDLLTKDQYKVKGRFE